MYKKNVLITGALGFIGFNFLKYLDNIPEVGSIIGVDKISDVSITENPLLITNYKFIQGHTKNTELIYYLLKEYDIDYCFHLAASSHVDNSIKAPDEFITDNIEGTYGLIKACLKHQKNSYKDFNLHYCNTDECYGSLGYNDKSFTEENPFKPNSPYSSSKAAASHLIRAYHKTFGLRYTESFSCNNFGSHQATEKLIGTVIKNAIDQQPIPIYGNGKNIREWIHVDQHCEAMWFIINNGYTGEGYNIGSGFECENNYLIDRICDSLETKGIKCHHLKQNITDRLGHDIRYSLNTNKINNLGWVCKKNFQKKLEETIQWYYKKYKKS